MKKGIKLRFRTRNQLRNFIADSSLRRGMYHTYRSTGALSWVLVF